MSVKKIEAIIKPFQLDGVKAALGEEGISGLTVFPVRGFGRQRGHVEVHGGGEYDVEFLPKVKIEVVVRAAQAARIVSVIEAFARTGRVGDGKVFVGGLDCVVRVRTGETGDAAV